mmetsp:Transcript_36054/g.52840  ORF Transcript_36054/g.52840 Transcript_36054/m.52840 type:complete len:274 (+) Transcript_36054:213-1034(+)|eukprot:CAMPEP_0195520556 /NCGR_PEP_ID=MMETSP0794_2-20130614/17162_1 /TAXON_ID=515487 /ORGANISM="Stephanopyxis turris, Strain CCMP 815" /LENGTH=273 /DNA_ID=CAMNT_0040649939 /DNA_START=205 /DNA_END=1026 /DNA_ORIENTATION=+
MSSKEGKLVKIVLIGNTGCGKTCIVTRFVSNSFDENVKNTVGAAFNAKTVTTPSGEPLKFQIWDTAGQERFKNLTKMYYQGSKAAICVFAINDPESFVGAKDWVKEMRSKATENAIIVLCANKIDIPDRKVSREEAESFAAANDLLYVETSAKTGENVEVVFTTLARELPHAERRRLFKNLKLLELQLSILEKEQAPGNSAAEIEALVQERRQLGGDMAVMDLTKEELQAEIASVKQILDTSDDDEGHAVGDEPVDLTHRKADVVVKRPGGCC